MKKMKMKEYAMLLSKDPRKKTSLLIPECYQLSINKNNKYNYNNKTKI